MSDTSLFSDSDLNERLATLGRNIGAREAGHAQGRGKEFGLWR